MGEGVLPIRFPVGGLSETMSYSDQEEATAREFQNMRVQDPLTRRLRGAQRSGLSKYANSPMKAVGTKIQDLTTFFVDNRQVTYTAATSGSETETWDEATPGGGACRNIKIDRQGNRYALSGNSGVVKFSADGTQVWQLAVPVDDTNHIIRALAISDDDLVYVGVSEGGDQTKAKLFCFEQIADNKTEKLWERTPGAYIEDITISQGKLYTCQNRPDRKKSHVRVYDFISTANPSIAREWRCPHPVNSIAVKKDGSVVVACEPAGDTSGMYLRERDPFFPESSPDSEDWTIDQLTDSAKRVWARLHGDSLDQSDALADFGEGVALSRWRDSSKNARHLYSTSIDGADEPPIYAKDAYLEHAGVRFDQDKENAPFQAMRTLPSTSVSKAFADQQRQIIPSYTDSAWALFIVFRPSPFGVAGTITSRWLIGQDRDNAGSGSDFHELFINTTSANGDTLPPTSSEGSLWWFTGETMTSGGGGTGGRIEEGDFDIRNDASTNIDGSTATKGQVVLATLICDNAVSGMTAGSAFRINGNPVDVFQSRAGASIHPTWIGVYKESVSGNTPNPSNTTKTYIGDILEIVVLDRKSRSDATQNVLTFPNAATPLQDDSPATNQEITECTLIEGWLMHKYGSYESLPYGTPATNNYPHPFGITGTGQDRLAGPPNQAGIAVSTAQALANKRFGAVVKYNAEGKIKWCANEQELVSGNRTGGFGYAVAVNSDGNIYSLGPAPTGTGSDDDAQVRLIIDSGDDFSLATADGAWSTAYPSNFNQTYKYPRIDVDEFDNLYTPFPTNDFQIAGFRVYKKDGTLLHSGTTGPETESYCIAADRRIPDYRTDLTTKRAEFITVGTNQANPTLTSENVHNRRLVNSTQSGASPRTLTTMAVSGGDIVKFTTSGTVAVTSGTGALDSAAYVQSTTLYKNVYWTDGRQYKEYHPVTNEVVSYKCTSAGQMPSRCALIETWRGRIVLARSADEPHNWFLSKKDEPNNYDFFPAVPGETDAVAGNNSPAGLCPDIINSVVPYSDDVLVFGGDRSIWALVGDPAAGGRMELVSDVAGMSFGRPWCKDPNGVLYFFGSQGGVFKWIPGARPERVSIAKIERQLQNVNLSTHYIRLVYNYKDEGIHILQCPFGAGGTSVSHWFLELNTNSFALDKFGTTTWTNVQPTAVMVVDGDAFDDRVVLFGCEDGYVRRWDKDAKSDDTRTDGVTYNAIDAFFTLFPLNGIEEEASAFESQFSGLTVVLDPTQDGARYELYASETPEDIGVARRMGDLVPGRNPPKWDRVSGPYCGLRIRNAAPEQRFAWERGYLRASSAGPARARSL